MKRPEILAPCGNMSALKAAVAAGADACYLAGNSFGARAYAANFSPEELIEAIRYAHLHDVKIYLTINTLVKNDELVYLYDMLLPLYKCGLDAVIVQDYGIFRMLRKSFPELEIHTSTQMNITTVEGAKLFKSLGATRVVAAREMTLKELADIRKKADIEVEAFVHGAMCLCYSGRCLMSSMLGGRSGNRGRCAQPCRQRYNGSYKLSMRDMCTLRYVPQLIEAGIDSFKIEGRMKNEYYVAATVMAYKELRDDYLAGRFSEGKAEKLEIMLLDIFNRGGFTDGYLFRNRSDKEWDRALIDDKMPGRRGLKVGEVSSIKDGRIAFESLVDIGIGDELLVDHKEPISLTVNKRAEKGTVTQLACPATKQLRKGVAVYRTRNKTLLSSIDEKLQNAEKIKVRGELHLANGKETELCLERVSDKTRAYASGKVAELAVSRPLGDDSIREKIMQLGNTDFSMTELIIENDNKSFIPAGELKRLRRNAVEKLSNAICDKSCRADAYDQENRDELLSIGAKRTVDRFGPDNNKNKASSDTEEKCGKGSVHISVSDEVQLDAVLESGVDVDYLYLDMGLGKIDPVKAESLRERIKTGFADKIAEKEVKLILALPYVCRNEYDIAALDFRELISSFDGLYVRCIDDLARLIGIITDLNIDTIILANSLYAYNDMAVSFIKERLSDYKGRVIFETPIELSKTDCLRISYGRSGTAGYVEPYYGRLMLMVTAGLRDTEGRLVDDKKSAFYVKNAGDLCYNVVLSAKPLCLSNYESEISDRLYYFTTESGGEVRDILKGKIDRISDGFTKGHYEKGI